MAHFTPFFPLSRTLVFTFAFFLRYYSIALVLWVSAMFSALLDNVAFTATMVPVIMQLAESVGEIWRMLTNADQC